MAGEAERRNVGEGPLHRQHPPQGRATAPLGVVVRSLPAWLAGRVASAFVGMVNAGQVLATGAGGILAGYMRDMRSGSNSAATQTATGGVTLGDGQSQAVN